MSINQELCKHRCCFTGHRPERLKQSEKEITVLLETAIRAAISDGIVTYISGMARGVDIWAAEIVLRLRAEGEDIHLVCAIPYEGFEKTGQKIGSVDTVVFSRPQIWCAISAQDIAGTVSSEEMNGWWIVPLG